MNNENETVEQALSKLISRLLYGKPKSLFPQEVKSLTDNILAAHKSEIAAKDEKIAELKTLQKIVAEQSKVNEAQADQLRDALNEVESLKWKVENYANVVAAKDEEIAKRDALIKELADNIETICDAEAPQWCGEDCFDCQHNKTCDCKKLRMLVERAREVING